MDTTGLINDFMASAQRNWTTANLLAETPEQKLVNATLQDTLGILKDVGKTRNITIIFGVESIALTLELEYHGNSPEERNSINTALLQLQEARQSLGVVKDGAQYQAATATYSSRRRDAGLPLDSMREFLKSHTTRLTNRLTAPLSVSEKNILRQRKENLRVVKELYVDMQREALGLPLQKANGQELTR